MIKIKSTIKDNYQKMKNSRWIRKHLDYIVAFIILIIGILYYFIGDLLSNCEGWYFFYKDIHTELIGIGITVLIISSATNYSQKQIKNSQKAIERLKSPSKEVAKEAVNELSNEGWLYDGSVSGSPIQHAYLAGADLSYANLSSADITNGDLSGSTLNKTNLRGANLRGADLSNANLEGADLAGAKYDKFTKWPNGFDPDTTGAIFVDD